MLIKGLIAINKIKPFDDAQLTVLHKSYLQFPTKLFTIMDFELFMALDDGIIDDILSSWLTITDLSLGLDNALTHSQYRETYLKHLYNASITLHQPVVIHPEPEKPSSTESGLNAKKKQKKQPVESEENNADDILYWLYHRNIAVEKIEFQRSIKMSDLQHIDQRMVDRIKDFSFTANVITELDVQCIAKCKNLKRLKIDCWIGTVVSDRFLEMIVQQCDQLEELELIQCQSITVKSITAIHQHLKQLKRLKLQMCTNIVFKDVTQFLQLLGFIPELSIVDSISFEHEPETTSSASKSVLPICPRITSLHMSIYPLYLIASSCPNVSKLTVVIGEQHHHSHLLRMGITAETTFHEYLLYLANNMSNVEEVCLINKCKNLDPIIYFSAVNQSHEKIKKIVLESATECASQQLMSSIVANFPSLTSLTLHNTSYARESEQNLNEMDEEENEMIEGEGELEQQGIVIEDDVMGDVVIVDADSVSTLPSLIELELINTMKISDMGVKRLAMSFPNLQILNLAMCRNVSSNGLVSLSQSLKSLKKLYISSNDCITSEAVVKILQANRELEELDLSKCSSLSDELLVYLQESVQPLALKRLDISMRSEFTMEALKQIIKLRYAHSSVLSRLNYFAIDSVERKEGDQLMNALRSLTKGYYREPLFTLDLS